MLTEDRKEQLILPVQIGNVRFEDLGIINADILLS